MRCGRFLACFAASVLSALTFAGFSSVDAFAEYDGGSYMTPTDFRDILGNDLTFTYYNGTSYEEGHFIYLNYKTSGLTMKDSDFAYIGSQPYLLYTCTSHSAINSNPGYITVNLSPRFSVTDTYTINTFVTLASDASSIASDVYSDSRWDWHFSGSDVHFLAPSYEGNDINSTLWTGGSSRPPSICIPASMSSDALSSGYSLDVKFYGASARANSQIFLAVGVPYISDAAQVVEGTLPPDSGGGGGDINVNVDVDLSETNGILGSIWDAITGIPDLILDGISSLFVPSSGYFESKLAPIKAKFSWYTDVVDAFNEIKTSIAAASSSDVPSLTLDLSDSDFYGAYISSAGESLVLSWMVEYRSVIRGFLTAFMWLFFLWRVYCHLPSIISGSSMEVQPTDDGGVEFHLKR